MTLTQGHTASIDGLRGLLAFGVFIHHASIWHEFLATGAWVVPESRYYSHLGQSTVSLFFMITGFLFYGKLLDSRASRLDWLRLYVSRCLRIMPLYFLVVLGAFLLIAVVRYSGWAQPMQPPWQEKSLTGLITAGVTWTLSYEWKFYFSLPILALTVRRFEPRWVLASIVMLLLTDVGSELNIHACAFAGGMLAALLRKSQGWLRFASSVWGSVLAVAVLASVVMLFDTAYEIQPLLLLSLAFALIANGADLGGFSRIRLLGCSGK